MEGEEEKEGIEEAIKIAARALEEISELEDKKLLKRAMRDENS